MQIVLWTIEIYNRIVLQIQRTSNTEICPLKIGVPAR